MIPAQIEVASSNHARAESRGAARTKGIPPALQTLKDAPQPHERLAFGLRSLKPASMRLSV